MHCYGNTIFKMRWTGKNGTVYSVRRIYKLCCYSNTFNCGHSVFAYYKSTLAVHSENPLMVSNLNNRRFRTTENVSQITEVLDLAPQCHWRYCKLEYLRVFCNYCNRCCNACSSCKLPSEVLQPAVATGILHWMRPTSRSEGIWMLYLMSRTG